MALRTQALDDDEEVNEGPLNMMAWFSLLGAAAALVIGLSCFLKNETFYAQDVEDTPAATKAWRKDTGDPGGMKMASDYSPFDKKDGRGSIISSYAKAEPNVPARPEEP